jgi:hypothetical protein
MATLLEIEPMNFRPQLHRLLVILALTIATTSLASAAEQGTLDPNLEPLRPWLGKTWKSDAATNGGKTTVDVARWERALNGKAVRMLHSINDGEYGGETIATWDEKKQSIVYQYFTTAGFITSGTIKAEEDRIVTHETVSGNAGGVTEVRGTVEMKPDATYRIATEYLKDGKWEPARDVIYREDPEAKVVFR